MARQLANQGAMRPIYSCLAYLAVLASLGYGSIEAVYAACTQQAITNNQSVLRLSSGDDICATNSGSIQASGMSQSAGVQIYGPDSGSATLLFTNTSSGDISVGSGTDVGVALSLNRGLTATIVNQGDISVTSSDTSTKPIGIQVVDGYMNGNPLVLENRGLIDVEAAGSGTGIFLDNTVATVANDGDLFVQGAIPTASDYSLYGIQAQSNDKLTPTSLISNKDWIQVRAQSAEFQSGEIAGIYTLGGSVANSGEIAVTGNRLQTAHGISVSSGNGGSINNTRKILVQVASSRLATGITFSGDLAEIQNSGTIEVNFLSNAYGTPGTVAGIYSSPDSARGQASRIFNTNVITVTSRSNLNVTVYGINVQGGEVSNSGRITASAVTGTAYGLRNMAFARSGSVTNTGIIETVGTWGAGVLFYGTGNVRNSGMVSFTGSRVQQIAEMQGVGIAFYGQGLLSNSGTVTVSAANGSLVGVQQSTLGSGSVFNNSGTITAQVTGNSSSTNTATGATLAVIGAPSSTVSATNSGTIRATTAPTANGTDKAVGVYLDGQNIHFINSGTIKAEGSTARAIEVVSTDTIVELSESSVIVGDIYTNQQGNILRHDVGAAQHYVLQTTGDWVLEDLDGRPVVKGSAMAAGVGRAETADEMLFERTQLFLQSMDRGQMRRDLAGDSALWVDPYAFDSKRSASSSDPTVMKYDSSGYGLTLGYDFKAFGIKAQAIGNIQWGKLNIDDNTQKVDNTSWLVGLRLPSFYEAGPVSFSAMAFAGRNQYSGDSQVLTNTTGTGTDVYSSSYGSTQLLFGLGAKYTTPLTETINLSVKADLHLSQEYIEGYQEGPYFSWNSRTLTQGSAFLEVGIDYYLTDPWLIQAKVGGNNQTLFSGKNTNYKINNTAVTFSGGQTNDTGLYAMLGTQYRVKDNAQVGISVWYGQSNNSVKTIQGMLEAKFLF